MKIAITAHGKGPEAIVDSRFSRANYFVLYDQEKELWDFLLNDQSYDSVQGTGVQPGQKLGKIGANILITGYIGPKAFKVLQSEQVTIYSLGEMTGKVKEALSAFLSGHLKIISVPNALDLKK